MKLSRLIILGVISLVAASGIAYPAYVDAPGYTVQETVFSIPYAWSVYGFDLLPNGNYVAFIDKDIVEITPEGIVSSPLYSFGGSVFGSFVKVRGNTVYFGESSNGTIWSMGLDGSNAAQVGTLGNPYDLAFDPLGRMFVSGNPGWAGQKLFYFDGTGDEVVTGLSGYSGPLAFDDSGNLIYVTAYASTGDFLLRFDEAAVSGAVGAGSLVQDDGQVIAATAPPSDLEIDSLGRFYVSSGGTIYRIVGGNAASFASSQYVLTTLAYGGTDTLYALANSVTVDGKSVGVISAITPVPEPGSLASMAGMPVFVGAGALNRRRARRS